MTKPKPKYSPIEVSPGTVPQPDSAYFATWGVNNTRNGGAQATENDTGHWIETTMCMFKGGRLRPIEGWNTLIDGLTTLYGVARTSYRYVLASGAIKIITGTSRGLYDSGTNITPFDGTATAIANSVNTTISSATVTVDAAAHGLAVGDKVRLAAAADTGGILAATLNRVQGYIVTAVPNANQLSFTAATSATSTVAAGGGAGTTYEKQILLNDTSAEYPIFWSMGVFGDDTLILTPGNGGKVYEYAGVSTVAPTLLTGAPAASNWVTVCNNSICSLYGNRPSRSATGLKNNWTTAPGSTAFDDDMEGYGRLLSAYKIRDDDLIIFSRSKAALMRFTRDSEKPYIFAPIKDSDGLAGPRACAVIDGIAFCMGVNKPYKFDGSTVSPLEGFACEESIMAQAKLMAAAQYASRTFAMAMPELGQVRWWWNTYDSNSSNTMADYVIYDYEEKHATTGRLPRTGAENEPLSLPGNTGGVLMLSPAYDAGAFVNTVSFLHRHQAGVTSAGYDYIPTAEATLIAQSPWVMLGNGDSEMEITDLVPDFAVVGLQTNTANITWKVLTKNWPQSTTEQTFSNAVTKTTEYLTALQAKGRLRSHRFECALSSSNNTWVMGRCMERVQESTP